MRRPTGAHGTMTALVMAALLAAGFIAVPGSVTGWAAGTTTFIWGKSGEGATLDSPVSTDGEVYEITTQIFNMLVRMKPGGTDIEPDLATSWSVSPDGLAWTFKLRQGVTFQDGTPFNADAVKFNVDRWADPSNPLHGGKDLDYTYWDDFMSDSFQEARVVDPYTVQFVLKKPNAPLIYNLSIPAFDFTSPAALKQYGAQGIGQHPVGTGAFKFVEWVHDDHVTMDANPSYFRGGLPKVQHLIMRVMKDNAARFLALKAGEINAMELPNPDDVKAAASDSGLAVAYRPPFNVGFIRFNMNDPQWKDKRLREAFAIAINRKAIVDALYGGYGIVAQQHMPPGMWGRANTPGYEYNPAMAKQLLAEAGYPNGFSVDFWYLPIARAYFPNGKDIGTAIASDLGKVGIKARLMTEDWASFGKDSRSSNKFQTFMSGWNGDNGDPDDWLGFFFPKYDAAAAYYSYNNTAALDMINKAKVVADKNQRADLYAKAELQILADYRDVPIAHSRVPLLLRSNVAGFVGQPNGSEYMESVYVR